MKVITNEGRVRRGAFFLIVGLGVEALSLYWRHPLALPLFLLVGGLLAVMGAASFLLAMVAPPPAARPVEVDELEELPRREATG